MQVFFIKGYIEMRVQMRKRAKRKKQREEAKSRGPLAHVEEVFFPP